MYKLSAEFHGVSYVIDSAKDQLQCQNITGPECEWKQQRLKPGSQGKNSARMLNPLPLALEALTIVLLLVVR
jgi:hypothetical protein